MSDNLIASFIRDMEARHRARCSIVAYRCTMKRYAAFLEQRGVPLEAVKRPDLKAYIDHLNAQGVSRQSARSYFATLCAFYDFLVFEEVITTNPVKAVQERYIQRYDGTEAGHTHQLISVEQAAALVGEMSDVQHKTLLVLMLKTGMRRNECLSLDVENIRWENQSIELKPTGKRKANRVVLFDDEAEGLLKRWLRLRGGRNTKNVPALWVTCQGRMSSETAQNILVAPAKRLGLHNSESDRLEDHFNSHCCRHWFTTHLDRAGMKREHIQFLRGDVDGAAIGRYIHADLEKIREEYLRCIPRLGI